MYSFPWYLTLVSTNHASSNPGVVYSVIQHLNNRGQVRKMDIIERIIIVNGAGRVSEFGYSSCLIFFLR